MNKIKYYSIILALFYLLGIVSYLYFSFQENKAAFKLGWESGYNTGKGGPELDHYTIKVKPKAGVFTFPESIDNQSTGENVKMEISEMNIQIPRKANSLSPFFTVFSVIVSFSIAFITIYIPVQTFKVINSILKDKLFDSRNIKRIRRIGSSLLIAYCTLTAYSVFEDVILNQSFRMEIYSTKLSNDLTLAVIGVATLLFSEILRLALQMKEEQDLTV